MSITRTVVTGRNINMKSSILPIIGGAGFRGEKLDEKLCFELWVHRGTSQKAAIALVKEYNISNPRTNKPYTHESVVKAAKRYALNHPDEARKLWEEKYGEVRDSLWLDYLSRISKILISSSMKRYNDWIEKHPEVAEYENSISN